MSISETYPAFTTFLVLFHGVGYPGHAVSPLASAPLLALKERA
ncbi:hypothetical protein NQF86_00720 [Bombella sp. TMW 2.2543]|uniref:Uncharacterized protein n=1 Tax=Bombella pluederhausensis TaxID=2967336 RepID=A0ABT3WDQ6_9PROT|nr:hypothetical protein [Bombella pluederhausensis]MCX5617196.1 hypothetical protein [Bombella pluederhausensis]